MNKEIYEDKIQFISKGFYGKFDIFLEEGEGDLVWWDHSMIKGFMDDDSIQKITFYSTNIGFVKTLTKRYRKKINKPPLGKAKNE